MFTAEAEQGVFTAEAEPSGEAHAPVTLTLTLTPAPTPTLTPAPTPTLTFIEGEELCFDYGPGFWDEEKDGVATGFDVAERQVRVRVRVRVS